MLQERWPEVTPERYIIVINCKNLVLQYQTYMINYKEIPANEMHGCVAKLTEWTDMIGPEWQCLTAACHNYQTLWDFTNKFIIN